MKKNREARELNIFEKAYIRLHFPNLKKYKKRQEHENSQKKFRIRIVDVNRLEFLEKLPKRLEGYLKQLNDNFGTLKSNEERINNLDNKVTKAFEMLKEKEHQRRKAAGKVGGLTASLNKEKEKTEQLLEDKIALENTIELQKEELVLKELELKEKKSKINIYKNLGKKKQISDYKKLQEIRKDIDNHKRIRGVTYDQQ